MAKNLKAITKKAANKRTDAEKKQLAQAREKAGVKKGAGLAAIQAGLKKAQKKETSVMKAGVRDASKNKLKTPSVLARRADENLMSRNINLGASIGAGGATYDENGRPILATNQIAYSGRVYTKENVGDLRRELNKRGITLVDFLTKNSLAASKLGIDTSDDKNSDLSVIRNRKNAVKRARRRITKGK